MIALLSALRAQAEIRFSVAARQGDVPVTAVRSQCIYDLTIVAEWPQSDVTYVVYTPTMPQLSGMVIKDHIPFGESASSPSQMLQRVVHHFKLLVTNSPGVVADTGPIFVEYRQSDREERDHRQLANIAFEVLPAQCNRWIVSSVGVGALGLTTAAGWLFLARRRRQRWSAALCTTVCVEDEFLKRLDATRHLRLEGDMVRYFAALEEILRDYVRVKYHIGNIEESNSNGALGLDERTRAVARDIVALARNVRYGGHVPSAYEQTRFHDFVRTLISRNQPRPFVPDEEHYSPTGEPA
jgi:hypothetical protein